MNTTWNVYAASADDLTVMGQDSMSISQAFTGIDVAKLRLDLPTPASPTSNVAGLIDLVASTNASFYVTTDDADNKQTSNSSSYPSEDCGKSQCRYSRVGSFVVISQQASEVIAPNSNEPQSTLTRTQSFFARQNILMRSIDHLESSDDFVSPTARPSPESSPESRGADTRAALVGRGASGSVRVVYDDFLGRHVAVKTVRPLDEDRQKNAANEFVFAQRAITVMEAQPQAKVFEHLVEIFEAAHDETQHEITVTMEHMSGGMVSHLPDFRPIASNVERTCFAGESDDGADEFEEILVRVVRDGLLGLRTLHDTLHVLHRDVKPENMLVAADGTVKLADFGVAAMLLPGQEDALDQAGSVLYMSPERLRGEPHGPKSDVWSLAVTALQLALRGQHPFISSAQLSQCAGSIDRFWNMVEKLQANLPECDTVTEALVSSALDAISATRGTSVSAGMRNFMRRALAVDVASRGSVADLLTHEWIARGAI
jgi:hypothetical protein